MSPACIAILALAYLCGVACTIAICGATRARVRRWKPPLPDAAEVHEEALERIREGR